ncbi:MAG: tRNA (uridine(34)/cytosine(34)/5-carboxymethylaminomethyluridine(34)-2'-O)-methyltransferase TrmL [Clostridia bacterium]|nr:tRNA (uridine(34)/cytosine(34)/5-carboxymethylaminomethyluridine(34)-2'-O)-methyltransferase TrmL [Clostridia bacterium]
MHIVLVNPEIPQNTGNIARTCAATGAVLHLIKPLGFSLEDKYVKRAGLDYWDLMELRVYENYADFLEKNPGANLYFATTKAPRDYCQVEYGPDDYLVFGRETKGLDEELLAAQYHRCIRIPMRAEARSLNLSNSVAIVLYEALRQQRFAGLQGEGQLHHTQVGDGWRDYLGPKQGK